MISLKLKLKLKLKLGLRGGAIHYKGWIVDSGWQMAVGGWRTAKRKKEEGLAPGKGRRSGWDVIEVGVYIYKQERD